LFAQWPQHARFNKAHVRWCLHFTSAVLVATKIRFLCAVRSSFPIIKTSVGLLTLQFYNRRELVGFDCDKASTTRTDSRGPDFVKSATRDQSAPIVRPFSLDVISENCVQVVSMLRLGPHLPQGTSLRCQLRVASVSEKFRHF
jgi:hypothetical protein